MAQAPVKCFMGGPSCKGDLETPEEKSRGCCMACLGQARTEIDDEVKTGPKQTEYKKVAKDTGNQKFKDEKCKECGKQAVTQVNLGNEMFYFCNIHIPTCFICKNTAITGVKANGKYKYYCEFHKDKPQKIIDATMIANAKIKQYNDNVKLTQRKDKQTNFVTYGKGGKQEDITHYAKK